MATKEAPAAEAQVEVIEPKADPVVTRAAADSVLDVMRKKYAAEPRVRVKVKNDGPVTVQVNGYSFLIRENVYVEVPESVRDILDDAGYI